MYLNPPLRGLKLREVWVGEATKRGKYFVNVISGILIVLFYSHNGKLGSNCIVVKFILEHSHTALDVKKYLTQKI